MGWKSTLDIERDEAISLIIAEMAKVHQKSNRELGDMMDEMFGDDTNKPYYGYNFIVVDKIEENEEY